MALVGDIIMRARRLIPDPPQVLTPPTITAAAASITPGLTPTGDYYVKVTYLTAWGESAPSNESAKVTIAANQGIQVTITSIIPANATGMRVYLTAAGGAAGTESIYVGYTTAASPVTLNGTPNTPGTPPQANTAFLPDTDGGFASAFTIFDWLTEALRELSRTTGGLRDYAGVQAIAGQPLYILPGNWIAITDIWYAGYWMQGGQRGNFFRANSIIAQILTSATISVQDSRSILEVYPQPANSGGSTTNSVSMIATDDHTTVANGGFASLPFGFMQIDDEIMAYSSVTGNLVEGLIRGLGGSGATTHAAGAPVKELNLVINGRRVFANTFAPGSSSTSLNIPPGWSDILTEYVMYMARTAEQDYQQAKQHMDAFSRKVAEWARTNSNAVKRRQIGPASVPEAYYGGVPGGGGWIIP